jgi:predicted nucleic acid-binding protein
MYEIRNVLLVAGRRGRLSADDIMLAMTGLGELNLVVDDAPDYLAIYDLATRYSLSFYDAAYLELARRSDTALATLDRRLALAAVAEGLPPFI